MRLAGTCLYVDDVPAVLEFYRRAAALGLLPPFDDLSFFPALSPLAAAPAQPPRRTVQETARPAAAPQRQPKPQLEPATEEPDEQSDESAVEPKAAEELGTAVAEAESNAVPN